VIHDHKLKHKKASRRVEERERRKREILEQPSLKYYYSSFKGKGEWG